MILLPLIHLCSNFLSHERFTSPPLPTYFERECTLTVFETELVSFTSLHVLMHLTCAASYLLQMTGNNAQMAVERGLFRFNGAVDVDSEEEPTMHPTQVFLNNNRLFILSVKLRRELIEEVATKASRRLRLSLALNASNWHLSLPLCVSAPPTKRTPVAFFHFALYGDYQSRLVRDHIAYYVGQFPNPDDVVFFLYYRPYCNQLQWWCRSNISEDVIRDDSRLARRVVVHPFPFFLLKTPNREVPLDNVHHLNSFVMRYRRQFEWVIQLDYDEFFVDSIDVNSRNDVVGASVSSSSSPPPPSSSSSSSVPLATRLAQLPPHVKAVLLPVFQCFAPSLSKVAVRMEAVKFLGVHDAVLRNGNGWLEDGRWHCYRVLNDTSRFHSPLSSSRETWRTRGAALNVWYERRCATVEDGVFLAHSGQFTRRNADLRCRFDRYGHAIERGGAWRKY